MRPRVVEIETPASLATTMRLGVRRIDPHVVVVAARRGEWRTGVRVRRASAAPAPRPPRPTARRRRRARRRVSVTPPSIERLNVAQRKYVSSGLSVDDGHARVVRLAAREVAIEADDAPVRAAVVGAPELTVVGRTTVQRIAVARLDQRVHAIRIRARDREADLSDLVRRKPVALKLASRSCRRRCDV